MVTVCVDGISILGDIPPISEDIYIEGYVTYTGKSTIEVRLDLLDQNNDIKMSAMFLMACRKRDGSGSYIIPKLCDSQSNNSKNFDLRNMFGKKNQEKRIQNNLNSLKIKPPNDDESSLLHELLIKNSKNYLRENYFKLNDTKLEKVIFAHEQNKNIHGKLFGGNIMRECFEIAFMAAYMIGKGEIPQLYHIGDTQVILYKYNYCSFLNLLMLGLF